MKFLSAIGPLLLSALTNALPNPTTLVGSGGEAGAKLSARTHIFCLRIWDQRNYQGNDLELCCTVSCCYIDPATSDRLRSAKATISPTGGVRLWTNAGCTGQSRWVDPEWWGIESAPRYQSYSQ